MTPITLSPQHLEALIALRRDLHAHPELGYEETRTADVVAARLTAAGLEVETGIAETGIVAVLHGELDGPTLGYRADMDALPIEEQTGATYRSCSPGRMHACGHDVHTAIGVGVAELLAEHRATLRGRRVFVFQPNEEGAPGAGLSGADAMVEQGIIGKYGFQGLFALHCMPSLDVGHIGYCPRGVWAGSDRLQIHVRGEQTHAAYPHLGVDPIVTSAHLITALQSVTSRSLNTLHACVLSISMMRAGQAFNIIPEEVYLEGILRTLDEATRGRAVEAIERIVAGTCAAFGATAELAIHRGALPVVNDDALLQRALTALRQHTPVGTVLEVPPQMGAEDFSAFSRALPSVYLLLGVRNEPRGLVHGLHSPRFDVDEACVPLAIESMSRMLHALML